MTANNMYRARINFREPVRGGPRETENEPKAARTKGRNTRSSEEEKNAK